MTILITAIILVGFYYTFDALIEIHRLLVKIYKKMGVK